MAEDVKLYTKNGLKEMLERNMRIKEVRSVGRTTPSRVTWPYASRSASSTTSSTTSRSRRRRGVPPRRQLDVADSHENALAAAPQALKLCQMIEASEDWECECDEIMDKFQAERDAGRCTACCSRSGETISLSTRPRRRLRRSSVPILPRPVLIPRSPRSSTARD